MTLSIASNSSSISAQTQLAKTTQALGGVYERLSSGLRINKASDDPAGLAIAEKLSADARVASVAIRNASDGISLTSIADAALGTIGSILSRLGELATQSANGVYTTTQRSALSSEFVALSSEIQRIAVTTTFNSINLLSNSTAITLQVGLDSSSNSTISISSVLGTLASLGLGNSGGVLLYSINDSSTAYAQSASTNALNAVTSAIGALSSTRGLIGAAQSRLTYAVDNLTVQRENLLTAASRIRDADIAFEAAELVRLQVLQQAGTAILAQANQQPARALDLLK
jgi:flagellin